MTSKDQELAVQLIPLNKLKKSPRNMRQVAHTKEHIAALANSIAAQGQIQNLVVETERDEEGKPTGHYLVTAGEGRRLAQLLRVKRKQIKAGEPIRCVVDDTHDAQAVSLAENDIRANMHPADQFEAFKRLVDGGLSAEDVAAQFGVTPLVVTRRLKLANVAPEFLDLYRKEKGKVSLEHLMALAVTDDHERQRKVWEALPAHQRTPDGLRDALTESEVPVSAPVVKFVGLENYVKAGGAVRRDLFSDNTDEGYAMDGELLWKLANERMEQRAELLRREGWSWVKVIPQMDYSTLSDFGRVGSTLREATEDEQTELTGLRERLDDVERKMEEAADEAAEYLEELAQEINDRIEAIEDGMRTPDPAQRALAGAVISVNREGGWHIVTDLLRPEDARRFEQARRARSKVTPEVPRVHSAALVRRLTAHRTLALSATVAQRPQVALLVLTHRLALLAFYGGEYCGRSVRIDLHCAKLDQYGGDIAESKAGRAMAEMAEAWKARLPQDSESLFGWLSGQSQEDLLSLCAYCVATSLDGVTQSESSDELDELAKAACLDMREWWTPTADGYLRSVPKGRIIQVLAEAGAPVSGATEKLKKTDLALVAEQQLTGTGWLPEVLRGAAA